MKNTLRLLIIAAILLCSTSIYSQNYSKGALHSKGSKIYQGSSMLKDYEIDNLFSKTANHKVHSLYISSKSIKPGSTVCYILGSVAMATGLGIGIGCYAGLLNKEISVINGTGRPSELPKIEKYNKLYKTGFKIAGAGAGVLLLGGILDIVRVSLVKKSVYLYNRDQLYSNIYDVPVELDFGTTSNGVGLVLKF